MRHCIQPSVTFNSIRSLTYRLRLSFDSLWVLSTKLCKKDVDITALMFYGEISLLCSLFRKSLKPFYNGGYKKNILRMMCLTAY